jgi:hypothetical protein
MPGEELTGIDRDCQDKEKAMKHESDEAFHPSNAFVFLYPDHLCPSLLIPPFKFRAGVASHPFIFCSSPCYPEA